MKICTLIPTLLMGILLMGCSESDMPDYTFKDCEGFVEPLMHFTEALRENINELEYGECADEELVKQIGIFNKQFSACVFVELLHRHDRGLPKVKYKNSTFGPINSGISYFQHQLDICPTQSSPKTRDLLVRTSRKKIDELHEKIILYLYPG